MDHRVSKDMISSGMTPSGKKSQADLGKTQYGSAPSPSRLMDAYQSMYQNQEKETLDEGKIPAGLQAFIDKKKGKKGKDDEDNVDEKKGKKGKKGKKSKGGKPDFLDLDKDGDKKESMKKASKEKKESVDLLSAYHAVYEHHQKDENGNTVPHGDDVYDLVYNHFIEEGFSEKEAYEKMSNLTEEQLDEFIGAAVAAGKMLAGKALKGAATMAGRAFGKVKNIAGKGINQVKDFARENPITANNIGNRILDSGAREKEKVNKSGVTSNQRTAVAASADLFDIVKGQLLDEGLSEEEIKDIMLELTPEEILNEISVDKMSNYMSAANKDVQKTADSIRKDRSVMGSDPRVKRLDKRATGMARAGQKIADKLKPKDTFLNMGEK